MTTSITGQGITAYKVPDDALSNESKNAVQNKVINGEVTDLQNAISELNRQLSDSDEYVGNILYRTGIDFYIASQFEEGNITITANGWTYSNSNTRVRTKNGTTIHLPAGILITLSDYTDARFYLGWLNGNNEYKTQGWVMNSGFTTTEEGDYVVLLSNKTETTITDIGALLDLLQIYNQNGMERRTDTLISFEKTLNLFTKGNTVPGYIEASGTISINDSYGTERSDYIEVQPDSIYTVQYWLETSHDLWCAIAEYNSSKSFLGRTTPVTASNTKYISSTFTTKSATKYIIVSYRAYDEFAPLMLTGGDICAAYIPSANDILSLIAESREKKYITGLKNPLLIPAKPRIVGHRGASSLAPENTIPAFSLAGEAHAWGIEADIRETSDGYFVCMHDEYVDGMTDGTGTVGSLTYAQIQAMTIDAGANISDYPNLKVPTLQEYLTVCRRFGCVAFIEVKSVRTYQNFVDVIKKYGFESSTVLIIDGEATVKKIRDVTDMPIELLYTTGNIDTWISTFKKYYEIWIGMAITSITSEKIEKLHNASIPIVGWSYTTKDAYISAINSGVDIAVANEIYNLDE